MNPPTLTKGAHGPHAALIIIIIIRTTQIKTLFTYIEYFFFTHDTKKVH